MLAFVIVLQILVALFLIGVVLLQPGNRGGASAALGGAGSDTVFGARGANTFLSKLTFGAAVCFMVTNFAISYMFSSGRGEKSVLDNLEKSMPIKKEAAPDAAGAAPLQDEGAREGEATEAPVGEASQVPNGGAAPVGEEAAPKTDGGAPSPAGEEAPPK
jgi:preprotein translocase subunit SecG